MIKKEYQKPTMNVEQLDTQDFLLVVSQANSEGLGGSDELFYHGDDADMDEYAW